MPDLSKILEDKEIQTTFFSGMCESGKFFPHIHPDEAISVISSCSDRNKLNVITCKDDGRNDFLEEVGGLNMMEVKLQNSVKRLPQFIPIIPREMFEYPACEIPPKTVGVVLNSILTKKLSYKCGYLSVPEGTRVDQFILKRQAFHGKRVILFSTGPDRLIETLWWNRPQNDIFNTIAKMGFAAVTGMNFSVFNGECPFGHALNLKKSLCYCKELEKLGVRTIPHIYAIKDYQRERWKNWLLANPFVQVATINTQLQRKQMRGMNDVYKTVHYLLENTSIKIIIHGSIKGLDALVKKFPKRIHYAASLKRAIFLKDQTPTQHINIFRRNMTVFTPS
jgi:hypothetical protein